MSNTLTVRLPGHLAAWLKETAERTGQSRSKVIRLQLEKALASAEQKPWMALAGTVRGPRDLSLREGFGKR
jgi:predicted transcriptional regulator